MVFVFKNCYFQLRAMFLHSFLASSLNCSTAVKIPPEIYWFGFIGFFLKKEKKKKMREGAAVAGIVVNFCHVSEKVHPKG